MYLLDKIKKIIKDDEKRTVIFLAISALSLILSFFKINMLPFDEAYIAVIL